MPVSAAVSPAGRKTQDHDIRVEVISAEAEFLALEPVWDRILQSADRRYRQPFLEFCWARTWWECFGGGSQLHILLVRAGKEPIAIAPLMLSHTRMFGLPMRKLGFFYNSHVPRAGFLGGKYPEAACRAIWRYLSASHCWDLLQLCQLPDYAPSLDVLTTLARNDRYAVGTWDSGASPYVISSGSWSDYFNSLHAKQRSNLRNRFRRIGPVELETVNSSARLDSDLEDTFRLEANAWKGRAGTAIACLPDVRRFYSEFARQAAARGWLRLNFLRAGNRRVACDYSLEYDNRAFLLKMGYDAALSACAPSQLLLSMVLRRAFETGLDEYDFLGEFSDWKRAWARDSTSHRWLYVFAPGLLGRLLHFGKFHLAPSAKRLLGRA